MTTVNRGGHPAGSLVQPSLGEGLRAQAEKKPLAQKPVAKLSPTARKTFAFQFGGFPGEAVPVGGSPISGQTLYDVKLYLHGRVVLFKTKLKGQIGLDQLRPGSPLWRELELRASQARKTAPAAPAGPLGYQQTPTITAWSPLVPLPKPLAQMNPTERILYTVEVARRYLPADLAAQLQALVTPQTALALGAYAAAHAVGVGFIADAVGLGLAIPSMLDAASKFHRYLDKTLKAKHPMELANAGQELSKIAAPLVMNGAALLGVRAVPRAIGGPRPSAGGRPPSPTDGVPGRPVINVRAVTVSRRVVPRSEVPAGPAALARAPTSPAARAALPTVSSTQTRSGRESSNSTTPVPGKNVVYVQNSPLPNQAPPGNQSGPEAQARMLAQLGGIYSGCDDQVKAVEALAPHVERGPLGKETPVKAKLLEVLADRRRDPEVREAAAWALAPHWIEESPWTSTPEKVEIREYLEREINYRRRQWMQDGRL
jgi:hypothetical protein